jgi:hypothetical protein
MEIHALNECRIFREAAIRFPPPRKMSPEDAQTLIAMWRGVGLKYQNPSVYSQLTELQHWKNLPQGNDELDRVCNDVRKVLEKFSACCKEPVQDYLRIFRIGRINGYQGTPSIPVLGGGRFVTFDLLCILFTVYHLTQLSKKTSNYLIFRLLNFPILSQVSASAGRWGFPPVESSQSFLHTELLLDRWLLPFLSHPNPNECGCSKG